MLVLVLGRSRSRFAGSDPERDRAHSFRWLWRWRYTCSHSEHRSQAHPRRWYLGVPSWESRSPPDFLKDPHFGGGLSLFQREFRRLVGCLLLTLPLVAPRRGVRRVRTDPETHDPRGRRPAQPAGPRLAVRRPRARPDARRATVDLALSTPRARRVTERSGASSAPATPAGPNVVRAPVRRALVTTGRRRGSVRLVATTVTSVPATIEAADRVARVTSDVRVRETLDEAVPSAPRVATTVVRPAMAIARSGVATTTAETTGTGGVRARRARGRDAPPPDATNAATTRVTRARATVVLGTVETVVTVVVAPHHARATSHANDVPVPRCAGRDHRAATCDRPARPPGESVS